MQFAMGSYYITIWWADSIVWAYWQMRLMSTYRCEWEEAE